jgi:hypothetical protein
MAIFYFLMVEEDHPCIILGKNRHIIRNTDVLKASWIASPKSLTGLKLYPHR